MNRGDFQSAMLSVDAQLQKHSSEQDDWHWRFLMLKGDLLARLLKNREALDLVTPPLPPRFGTSDIAVWRKLSMGSAHGFSEQFPEAQVDLDEAEFLANKYHPELLAQVALRKGTVAFLQHDLAAAKSSYSEALRFARSSKDVFAEVASLGSLGLVATSLEHYDEAIDRNRAAKDLSESVDAASSRARIMGNMGWSYFELGDFDAAMTSYQLAAEASHKSGLISDEIYWLTGVANSYDAQHDDDTAESILNQALVQARRLDDKIVLTECLNDLSSIDLDKGRVDLAELYNKEASDLEKDGLDQTGTLYSLIAEARIRASTHRFKEAEQLFLRIIGDPKAETSLRWEGEARLAHLYQDEGLAAKAEREYGHSLETIEAARSSVKQEDLRISFLSSAISFYGDYIDFLVTQGRTADALRIAESGMARTLAEGLGAASRSAKSSVNRFRPRQIAERAKATLLFYSLGRKHSHLWVITPAKITYFALPPASEIDPAIKSYREALLGPRDPLESSNPDGRKLYDMLVAPAVKLIPQGSRLILLPDSSLYSLNFDTLIVSGPKPHYFIEDATISTANSLTLLNASVSRPAFNGKKLLLVGDTLQANTEFPLLRQAPQEVNLLEKYFSESERTVLVKDKATPAAYLSSNPGDYAYLHFVTHGTASRTRPLESAVILSPEGDSYKLYARDIVQHHLNAQLVTISACNGSGTRTYSGEGLVGLSWAFLRAGAHNVIGALWEVSDTASPQLMDKLYDGLTHGQDPATALRNAKLSFLHSRSPYKKPYYWAPFQLYSGS